MKKYRSKLTNTVLGLSLAIVGIISGQGLLVSIGAGELTSVVTKESLDHRGSQ